MASSLVFLKKIINGNLVLIDFFDIVTGGLLQCFLHMFIHFSTSQMRMRLLQVRFLLFHSQTRSLGAHLVSLYLYLTFLLNLTWMQSHPLLPLQIVMWMQLHPPSTLPQNKIVMRSHPIPFHQTLFQFQQKLRVLLEAALIVFCFLFPLLVFSFSSSCLLLSPSKVLSRGSCSILYSYLFSYSSSFLLVSLPLLL